MLTLRKAFANGLFRVVLPQLKEKYPTEVMKVLRRRIAGGFSDMEVAFWASLDIYDPQKAFSAKKIAARFSFSLDLIMANKDINLEKRREIIGKFWELCKEDFGIIVGKNEKIEL